MIARLAALPVALLVLLSGMAMAEEHSTADGTGSVRVRIESSLRGIHGAVPAVIWLEPMPGTPPAPFQAREEYKLVQKNRTFIPHMQVIPDGAVVRFPNEDPFFHNVFSLYDGKRFDLGLYEAGSSKSVTFSREGVSYIFCNIHPEMSAIIIALDTSLYAIADPHDAFELGHIAPGDYTFHLWIESVPPSILDHLARTLHVPSHMVDLGVIRAPITAPGRTEHENMFGHPYAPENQPPY